MTLSHADLLALIQQVPIPDPWDLNGLVANVARMRKRPITLMSTGIALAFTDGPCGLWLALEDRDLIVHELETSDYHIDQIVCHELGHMLLGHKRCAQFSDEDFHKIVCNAIVPAMNPAKVQAVFARRNFDADQEHDAETFANMLMVFAAEKATQKSIMSSAFFGP